jgi:hypothetical protein
MYSSLAQKFLIYCEKNPEEKYKDLYEHFYLFLTLLLGINKRDAQHEVAIFMNDVYDHTG